MEHDLDYKEIGRNIRYYRQRANLKQNQLSDMIDVSPQHISHIESGVKLSLPVLVKIANALSVDANCLLGNNLKKKLDNGIESTLFEETKNLSPEEYEKLFQLCDIIFK